MRTRFLSHAMGFHMFAPRFMCLLAVLHAGGMAMAQSGQQLESTVSSDGGKQAPVPAVQSETRRQEIKTRVAEWLATCLKDWDQATHMTRREWQATCKRVASERGKFLLDNPTVGASLLDATKSRRR